MRNFGIAVLLCLLFFTSMNSFGQISIGAQAGVNTSKLIFRYHNVNFNTDRLATFTAGVPVEFKFSKLFSLQPELNYIVKGGNNSLLDTTFGIANTWKFSYIELPLNMKFSLGNEKMTLDLFAGFAMAFGLGASVSFTETVSGYEEKQTLDLDYSDDEINRWDFSYDVGLGGSYMMGANKIFLNLIYRQGLSNMSSRYQPGDPLDEYSFNNNNIIVTVGYMMPLAGGSTDK